MSLPKEDMATSYLFKKYLACKRFWSKQPLLRFPALRTRSFMSYVF